MQSVIAKLKKIAAKSPNGFTVTLPDLTPVVSGWIVAMAETQDSFGDDGLQKALEVALKTSKVIGGWKEGRKWYWDASFVFQDEEEATRAGKENGQIAIYHLDTATLKYL